VGTGATGSALGAQWASPLTILSSLSSAYNTLLTGSVQGGHQYRHQYGNNGNYHQKLYQGKGFSFVHIDTPSILFVG
jgi:hypothetical protein